MRSLGLQTISENPIYMPSAQIWENTGVYPFGLTPNESVSIVSSRHEQIYSIPAYGYPSLEDENRAREQLLATGLPISGITSLHYKQNKRGQRTLGSADIINGKFTEYSLLGHQVPENQIGTFVHEDIHIHTCFLAGNEHLYGEELEKVQKFAIEATRQSLQTGIALTPYHDDCIKRFQDPEDEFDFLSLCLETESIASELAYTNRKKLVQIEREQANALKAKGIEEHVIYLSTVEADGTVKAAGVDIGVLKLLEPIGIKTPEEFILYTLGLKQNHYSPENFAKAMSRANGRAYGLPEGVNAQFAFNIPFSPPQSNPDLFQPRITPPAPVPAYYN